MTSTAIGELDNLKVRLKSIWMAGDYDRFSRYMEGGAREFYERLPVAPGFRLKLANATILTPCHRFESVLSVVRRSPNRRAMGFARDA
jgi:hypothetical protein